MRLGARKDAQGVHEAGKGVAGPKKSKGRAMEYKLTDLIDLEMTGKLLESFFEVGEIPAAIIDLEGTVLVSSRWQRICKEFHRTNEKACRDCIESDTVLANELLNGKRFSFYRCPHGLTDAASPVTIEGKHVANAFIGQFFTRRPDIEFFRRQAAEYGFSEEAYLQTLAEVPVVAEESLPPILAFLTSLAEMTATMGLKQLGQLEVEKELQRVRSELEVRVEERTAELLQANRKLQEEMAERRQAENHIRANNALLKLMIESSSRKEYLDGVVELIGDWSQCSCIGIRVLDQEGNIPYESHVGFDREFWEHENWLSLARDDCACIRVVTGAPEPQDEACMTPAGSFVINDSAKFLASLSEEGVKKFRGVCIANGFRSIGVIPVRDAGKVVGVIHLCDRRQGMVPEKLVGFIEGLSPLVGEAISKFNIRKALEAQNEARLRLVAIVEYSNDAIISRTLEGVITSWNAAAERIYGYSAEEATGRRITLIHPPENLEESGEMLRRAASGERIVNYETLRVRKDGKRIDVSITVSPIVDALGWIIGVSSIHRDISERKRAEQEVKAYMAKLESVNRELQEFSFVASHDLQEPLRKIQKFSDLVCMRCSGALEDEGIDYLRRMQNAARRMEALLDALLAYSRVTTKSNPFVLSDLKILTEEVVSDLELLIEKKNATVELGDFPVVEVDPTQFMQLLQNLISNGLKYNKNEKPTVRVHGESCEDGTFRIYVEDNGIGFEEKYLDRIFQPFQRLHGRSSPYEGTGMGLAICKKIAERHGGALTAKSKPDSGSTFTVTLPASQTGV
jgi:PAS domain S-box-containing protein